MGGNYVIQDSYHYQKETWYRIEARENVRSPLTFKVGDHIMFPRYIVRAGYLHEPHDCPVDTQRALALDIAIEKYEKLLQKRKRDNVWVIDKKPEPPPITKDQINLLIEALDTQESRILRHMLYLARKRWLSEVTDFRSGLRTFWYDDCLDFRKRLCIHGEIKAIKAKWVGQHYPASGGYDSYTGETDYEPGGLISPTYHQIYKVLYNDYIDVLVHPLDAIAYDVSALSRTFETKDLDILKTPSYNT